MKTFKKFLVIMLMFTACFGLTGCGQKNIEGSLEDIMEKIYKDIPEDEFPMMLENRKVDDETVEYFLGTKDIEYKEALASESGVGSIAYSVVLVRAKEGADIEAMKDKIKKSVNPRKWICVEVEKENVLVESKGDLIILIMSNDLSDEIKAGFDKLK